jgi:sulfiredoxin
LASGSIYSRQRITLDSGLAKRHFQVQDSTMLKRQQFPIANIRVPSKRLKTLEADKVREIAEDMLENGQTTPIRVREDGENFVLIEGFHRLEALRALGEETVEGYLVQARLH